ncbi:MAG: SHOCT domain-containing protein [Neptuniibacter sp.]
MQTLTPQGTQLVQDVAQRYNLSQDAVLHMLIAVNNGAGSMAQFNCPELGGSGQWMRGGMTMVGDMFNYGLKATVDNLCNELSNALVNLQVFPVIEPGTPGSNQWWPADLGAPFSSGGQNDIRYAVFPGRLAVEHFGQVTVYDTLDHQIGGVSQQQGGDTSLTFSSQYGTVSVSSLPIVSGPGVRTQPNTNFAQPQNNEPQYSQPEPQNTAPQYSAPQTESSAEALDLIEKLAHLRDAGAISDEEFTTKKNELLQRI